MNNVPSLNFEPYLHFVLNTLLPLLPIFQRHYLVYWKFPLFYFWSTHASENPLAIKVFIRYLNKKKQTPKQSEQEGYSRGVSARLFEQIKLLSQIKIWLSEKAETAMHKLFKTRVTPSLTWAHI